GKRAGGQRAEQSGDDGDLRDDGEVGDESAGVQTGGFGELRRVGGLRWGGHLNRSTPSLRPSPGGRGGKRGPRFAHPVRRGIPYGEHSRRFYRGTVRAVGDRAFVWVSGGWD